MQVDPVISDFEYVTIRRSGGILGLDQMVSIDRTLQASVTDRCAADRTFGLDASTSQELMAALSTLIARQPEASTRSGFDMFHYDIEVSWGGEVHRFNSVDIGADEALHGVMFTANRLLQRDPDATPAMTLHAAPPDDA